MEVRVILGLRN